MRRLGRALLAPVLLVALMSDVSGPAFGATTPPLGSATTYGVLASTYINPVPGTTINGDVGFMAAPAVVPAGVHPNYGSAAPYATAGADQASALTLLAAQPCSFTFPATPIDLATDTTHGPLGVYTPGVYCSTSFSITTLGAAGITLNGAGTYIFRMGNVLSTAANSIVHLLNGASACNTWWTPSPGPILTTLGANSVFKGNYIDSSGITMDNNVSWVGRALAFGGTVKTSVDDTISVPSCSIQEPSVLRVVKTVVNNNGSTAVASDFNLHVKLSGVDVSGSPAVGVVSPGKTYFLTNGSSYVVSEDLNAGYAATFSGDCDSNGTVTLGPTPKTCTITNTHILTTTTCSRVQGGAGWTTVCVTTTSTPTPTPSPSSTPTDTGTPTPSPTPTTTCVSIDMISCIIPGPTPSPTPTVSGSPTPSPTPTTTCVSIDLISCITPGPTPKPTSTVSGKPTPGPSPSTTPTGTGTPSTRSIPGSVFIPIFPNTGFSSSGRYPESGTPIGTPVRLYIPKLKVNAVVERIGLTSTKAVDVPKGHGHVGWYKLGPRPGDEGTAVIDGHFARKTSGWAVFNDLYKLRQGDALSIKDSNGKVIKFVVQSIRIYDAEARPSEVYVSDSGAHLNLITCTGTWINALHGFNKRLVVFTDIVN